MAEQNLVPHSPDAPHDNTLARFHAANESGPGHAGSAHRQTRNAGRIPSRDRCIRAVNQVANLLLMGVITTSQANAKRGLYTTLLDQQQEQRHGGHGRPLDDQGLLSVLRSHPELAGHLEPLLSDEQIATLMKQDGRTIMEFLEFLPTFIWLRNKPISFS